MKAIIICDSCGYKLNKNTTLKCALCGELGPYRAYIDQPQDLIRQTHLQKLSPHHPEFDLICLEIGTSLIALAKTELGGQLLNLVKNVRKKVSEELEFSIEPIRVIDSYVINHNAYQISLEGEVYAKGEIDMSPNSGYTMIDASTTISMHLDKVLFNNTAIILGYTNLIDPNEVRLKIQELVTKNRDRAAIQLAAISLIKFPENIALLALSGLLEMVQENWPSAIDYFQRIISIHKDSAQPMTFQMLSRSLACNYQLTEANKVLEFALKKWPEDRKLLEELNSLNEIEGVSKSESLFYASNLTLISKYVNL